MRKKTIILAALAILAVWAIPTLADYITKIYRSDGGDKLVVVSGGEIEMQSGAVLDLQSGTTLSIGADMTVTGLVGGDSALGITGQGAATAGTVVIAGGVDSDTNGNGGLVSLTGGAGKGTGTGGAASLVGGASAGSGGTAGAVSIDAGAASGGTGAGVVIGGTNATGVTLAATATTTTVNGALQAKGDITLAANKSLSGTTGTGSFNCSSMTGTFQTSSGTNTVNGNLVIAGSKTFTTGTGTMTVNGDMVITGSKTFTTGTGTLTVKGNVAIDSNKSITAGTGSGALDFHNATGTFQTSSGTNIVNGDLVIAGSKTFTSGTGTVSLNGDTYVAAGKNLILVAGAGYIQANGTTSGGIKIAPIATGTAVATIQNQNVSASTITLPSATCTLPGLGLANVWTSTADFRGNVSASASNPNIDFSGSSGTFKSCLGEVTLGGNVTISGAKTFATGSGTVGLNGNVTVAAGKYISLAAGAGYIQINGSTSGALKLLPTASTAQTVTLTTAGQTSGAGSISIPDLAGGSVYFVKTANATGYASRSELTTVTDTLAIPLTAFRKAAAIKDNLPDAGDTTSLGLAEASGSLLLGSDANGTSVSETAGIYIAVPYNYVAAGAVNVVIRAKITATVEDPNSQTIDLTAKELGDTLGSDVCATSAQILTTSFANYTFSITPTNLVAGDILELIVTGDANDTGGAHAAKVTIQGIKFNYAGK